MTPLPLVRRVEILEETVSRPRDVETRRQMRILHEDVISRIARLQKGLDRRSRE